MVSNYAREKEILADLDRYHTVKGSFVEETPDKLTNMLTVFGKRGLSGPDTTLLLEHLKLTFPKLNKEGFFNNFGRYSMFKWAFIDLYLTSNWFIKSPFSNSIKNLLKRSFTKLRNDKRLPGWAKFEALESEVDNLFLPNLEVNILGETLKTTNPVTIREPRRTMPTPTTPRAAVLNAIRENTRRRFREEEARGPAVGDGADTLAGKVVNKATAFAKVAPPLAAAVAVKKAIDTKERFKDWRAQRKQKSEAKASVKAARAEIRDRREALDLEHDKVAKERKERIKELKKGTGAFSKMKAKYKGFNEGFKDSRKDRKEGNDALFGIKAYKGDMEVGEGPMLIFLLMCIALHLYDVLPGLNGSIRAFPDSVLYLLILLTIFGILFFRIHLDQEEAAIFIGISVAAYVVALPYHYITGTSGIMRGLIRGIALFPIWPAAIGFWLRGVSKGAGTSENLARLYTVIWVFIIIGAFIAGSATTGDLGKGPFEGVGFGLKQFFANIRQGAVDLPGAINRSIHMNLGTYYEGEVEDNQNEPTGLTLENIRAADSKFFTHIPIVLWFDVKGQSFKSYMDVISWCKTQDGILGVIDPPEPIQIYFYEQQTIECRFEALPKDFHTIQVGASFNFETWAYLKYTFMDRETLLSMYSQNKDVHGDLEIDRIPRAVYTNGPISIGMLSVDQPIGINAENINILPTFGISLTSRDAKGSIERIDAVEVIIPKELAFKRCDHPYDYPATVKSADDYEGELSDDGLYRIYNFSKTFKQAMQGGQLRHFDDISLTCRLAIAGGKDNEETQKTNAAELLGLGVKSEKTFAVKAKYIYLLEDEINIQVSDMDELYGRS